MSTPYDDQLEELRAGYQAQLAQIGELQSRMREVTGTATAKAQAMKVTVGPQGELLSVEFPTGAYRSMAPKELADLIVKTVQEARGKATAAVAEVMAPHLPQGFDTTGLLNGSADVTQLMGSEPVMPDAVREYVDRGRPV
ncbi:YbaB/EbfC family nucleoid-associated protein [Streptomyces sp. NRRL S-31]|uniref:YbaB/EbfC family nucleoid-associated protein n=1 Tax=Streptomyces sp. NRRL S-31 TaxID=1463898 RepID=UPI0004C789C0|nr:YbaB/EbfC family nucleoid-associated protein [Streptomyces sp. NRRL S-31]